MALMIQNVTKAFTDGKAVLKDINLNVGRGEFVCLLGPSGCGKSTLLNMVAGLDAPSIGHISLDGKSVAKPGPDRSYLFQEHALFPWLNVIDNVKFGMRMNGISKKEQHDRAMKYLRMVRLEKHAEYRVHELSGGMKQRVALARALTLDSDILLMDEPFAALDSHTKSEMCANLIEIWQQTKKTVLFVTHNIEEALSLGDRVLLFSTDPSRIIAEYQPRGKAKAEMDAIAGDIETALAKAGGIVDIAC